MTLVQGQCSNDSGFTIIPYLDVQINDDSLPVVGMDEDSLPGCPE